MSKVRGNGMICVWTDINQPVEEEFNTWYEEEHMPERVNEVPGIISARRYTCIEGDPKHLAVYDLEDPSALESEEYKGITQRNSPGTQKMMPNFLNTVRNIYSEILEAGAPPEQDTEYMLGIRLNIAPENDALFNSWYNEDHLPALGAVEGVRYARRFKMVESAPSVQPSPGSSDVDSDKLFDGTQNAHTYLALYEMDSLEIMETEDWKNAAGYGRTAQVRPLFKDVKRNIYKLIFSIKK